MHSELSVKKTHTQLGVVALQFIRRTRGQERRRVHRNGGGGDAGPPTTGLARMRVRDESGEGGQSARLALSNECPK